MRILIMGPQGAGKGTQAELLSGALSIPHISTGDIFRWNVDNATELGRRAQRAIGDGRLVPDDVTTGMVQERLTEPDVADGFILDGFPRTLPQAQWLTRVLKERAVALDVVLSVDAPLPVLLERLMSRGRPDDTADAIRTRLQLYAGLTAPLLQYYRDSLIEVDGTGSPQAVFDTIMGALSAAMTPLAEERDGGAA